jgi:ATP-dependent DNA helicase UvrD/PcrA
VDMSINNINSDSKLSNIEQHFRVSAGPGAGKTYWLVEHIKNVLHNSGRLAKTRKIACITYTNVAVDIIQERLGASSDRVEVSTIHSFLYKHIVKPYAAFLESEYGLNAKKIDGHDDTILSNYSFLKEWKTRTKQARIREDDKVIEAFKSIRWIFDNGTFTLKTKYPHIVNNYAIKNDSYLEYKKMTWGKGVIHHDDVLFFSYQLIDKYPFILHVLRAKFPFFFIDEFQDTNPVQTKILELIGEEETIVGIIGDKAQSIYSFQGAKPSQFSSFILPGIVDFKMVENRRSTNQIIDFLNNIRRDISQNKHRNTEGENPTLIVSEMNKALHKARLQCNAEEVYSLARDNITANAMKKNVDNNIPTGDLLQDLYNTDSNKDRKLLIIACIKAVEHAKQKLFKDAIKELERIFKNEANKTIGKREALKTIIFLLGKYDLFQENSLLDFHLFISENVKQLGGFRAGGAIRNFYEGHTYKQFAICTKITDDKSPHRTIHKAKGDEFDNVLLIFKDESDLSFILSSDLENNEEHRVYYVASSRAKERLFISVPSLSDANRTRLTELGIEITGAE